MPHSSGGGSHGGGSHSSSHSSSSRSGGSSYGSSHKIYSRRVPGCYTYLYYKKSQPQYLYTNYNIETDRRQKKTTFKNNSILLAICLFVILIIVSTSFIPPKKLTTNYDTTITIQQANSSETNVATLRNELKIFQKKTGITPCVISVNNEDWKSNYNSLENYAYDIYVNTYDDENHWLIVYSEPKISNSDFIDWYWEGMQGDNTDSILNDKILKQFNQAVQKYLTQHDKYTPTQAITQAFKDINPVVRNSGHLSDVASELLYISIVFTTAIFLKFVADAISYFKTRNIKYENITAIKDIKEKNCEYCGGLYIVGKHLSCPHCGAIISATNPNQSTEDDRKKYIY